MKGIKQLSNQNFNMSAMNSNISSINFNSNMASMMNINNSIIFDRKINSKAKSDSTESSTCDKPIYKWVSDSAVTSCYSCACTFSLFIRRHHCRVCGRIFCHNCCNNWKKIPANISIPQKNYTMRDALTGYIYSKTDAERVCNNCSKLIEDKNKIDIWLLCFRYLDIKEVYELMTINSLWYNAAKQYMTIFRGIQYKFFTQSLSSYEYDIMSSNAHYFSGHSKWIFNLMRAEYPDIIHIINSPQVTNCKNILCSSKCGKTLECSDIVQLLYGNNVKGAVKQHLLALLEKIDNEQLACYVPLFIELIKQKDTDVTEFIINKMCSDRKVMFLFAWEFARNKIDVSVSAKIKKNIDNIRNMFYSMQAINFYTKTNYKDVIGTAFNSINDFYLFCEDKQMIGVDYDNIVFIKSKSMPLLIPLILKDKDGKIERKKFLFKKDYIFQDYIVCKVIKLMFYLLKQDKIIECDNISYEVFLLSNTSGFVEVIDDAETIYNLKHKYETTILNYILLHNKQKTVEQIRSKFINSLAVYSIITYLLGIGDRHLNNIMIHKSGYLFHIDFGYILGNDPKFRVTYIRLSDDMLDALGGKNSENYGIFKKKCSKIFNCLRKHLGIISSLLTVLTLNDNTTITKEHLTNELINRFEPGEKYLDAGDHIRTIVDNSHDNITSSIFDVLYRYANYVQ